MFDDLIRQAAAKWNVPEAWINAVIDVESSFQSDAYRAEPQINDASYGLMQLLYGTAQRLGYAGSPDGLYDPATNIDLGSQLLGQLRASYGDDFRRVYSAYNSGKPDLWQTSSQVAANVGRALAALETYVTSSVQTLVQSSDTAANSGSLAALLIGILVLAWAGTKRR
jgi:soluble lytic murein transglycosylase-like protein